MGFSSAAPNLTAAGSGGRAQVFARTLTPRLGPRTHGRSVQRFVAHTILVSRGPNGAPGNGAATTPTINAGGDKVAFATHDTNLLPGDTHGVSQIALATRRGDAITLEWISSRKTGDHGLSRTDSLRPAGVV